MAISLLKNALGINTSLRVNDIDTCQSRHLAPMTGFFFATQHGLPLISGASELCGGTVCIAPESAMGSKHQFAALCTNGGGLEQSRRSP